MDEGRTPNPGLAEGYGRPAEWFATAAAGESRTLKVVVGAFRNAGPQIGQLGVSPMDASVTPGDGQGDRFQVAIQLYDGSWAFATLLADFEGDAVTLGLSHAGRALDLDGPETVRSSGAPDQLASTAVAWFLEQLRRPVMSGEWLEGTAPNQSVSFKSWYFSDTGLTIGRRWPKLRWFTPTTEGRRAAFTLPTRPSDRVVPVRPDRRQDA